MPHELMISFKAMSATGLWNNLYKVGHLMYLIRWLPWVLFYLSESKCKPRIMSFFKALKENEAKDKPVGTAGFCWGGKYVTELCWDQVKAENGKRLVDCGFTAHPSNMKYPGDFEMIILPYSCAAAEHDQMMSPEQAKQTKDILSAKTAKTKDSGVEHEFQMYDGAHHGFAVRGKYYSDLAERMLTASIADEDEKIEAEQGKRAEDQAVNWFKRWFAKPPPEPTQ